MKNLTYYKIGGTYVALLPLKFRILIWRFRVWLAEHLYPYETFNDPVLDKVERLPRLEILDAAWRELIDYYSKEVE